MVPSVTAGCLKKVLELYVNTNMWNIQISIDILKRLKYYIPGTEHLQYLNALLLEVGANGNADQFSQLLAMGTFDSVVMSLAFHESCRSGKSALVTEFLKLDIDINYIHNEMTALLLAILSDHFEIVDVLLLAVCFAQTPGILKTCGTASDPLNVTDVEIYNYPFKAGQTSVISTIGDLSETIVNGTKVVVSVKVGTITLYSTTQDYCSEDGITCPVQPGHLINNVSQVIPANIPAGSFNLQVKIVSPTNTEIYRLFSKYVKKVYYLSNSNTNKVNSPHNVKDADGPKKPDKKKRKEDKKIKRKDCRKPLFQATLQETADANQNEGIFGQESTGEKQANINTNEDSNDETNEPKEHFTDTDYILDPMEDKPIENCFDSLQYFAPYSLFQSGLIIDLKLKNSGNEAIVKLKAEPFSLFSNGKKGDTVKYIARTQAVRKLQISLAQFRRLCILKGIYPVEPKNKRKVSGGSTALKTFYYRKDIAYLMHEPILQTLRLERIHQRKLGKALGKKQYAVAKQIHEDKPFYTLDHIIKERDLDDALSMIALFATLPADDKIPIEHVKECQRLLAEFQHYVMITGCLTKVFLSIKGIYYQVEIKGQTITWISPYQFSQDIPHDVDFRVMGTFLEVHETLLSFVNYKLFSDINLIYPPQLDMSKYESGGGLNAFVIEPKSEGIESLQSNIPEAVVKKTGKKLEKIVKERLESLKEKISTLEEEDEMDVEYDDESDDEAPEPIAEPTSQEETVVKMTHNQPSKRLFSNCVFWISREVPRYSLEFVIKAHGGQCGWDASSGSGSPFAINDPKITHHITDRPITSNTQLVDGRENLQPQWVYDSINSKNLVKSLNYHPGEALPPHLSPFVNPGEDDYRPDEEITEDQIEEPITEEELHEQEIQAEVKGIPVSEFKPKKTKKEETKDEEKELLKIMMSKRDKKLYDKIQYGKERKKEQASKLREKRKMQKQ
ncbi:mRNA-binding ribosome synthesis protein nop7 [Terramyces sp. JEL0728]|nr:mRNA-binding ribosome synthesis protein nop7 [Terramyces sp. JEL0728]